MDPQRQGARFVLRLGSLAGICLFGCHPGQHSAPVQSADLPPPPVTPVFHTSRLVVEVTPATADTQCLTHQDYRPLCFEDVRSALEKSLLQGLWPAFPEVVLDEGQTVAEGDYRLQVEVLLDALPPDVDGPGWSAGARGRFRLLRGSTVLAEETLASRSRAEFPWGSALGQAASEVVDGTAVHIASVVARVEEQHPRQPRPLPAVASRKILVDSDAPASPPPTPAPARQAKSKAELAAP